MSDRNERVRISLTREELDQILEAYENGTLGLSGSTRDTIELADDPDRLKYVELAREQWHKDGEIEIDDDAAFSPSGLGAYVQAWVWVDKSKRHPGGVCHVCG